MWKWGDKIIGRESSRFKETGVPNTCSFIEKIITFAVIYLRQLNWQKGEIRKIRRNQVVDKTSKLPRLMEHLQLQHRQIWGIIKPSLLCNSLPPSINWYCGITHRKRTIFPLLPILILLQNSQLWCLISNLSCSWLPVNNSSSRQHESLTLEKGNS